MRGYGKGPYWGEGDVMPWVAEQANSELRQMTVQALLHALLQQATEDDIRLLCFHAGVQFKEIEQCQKSMK